MKAAETIPNSELAKMLVDEQEKVKALRKLCWIATENVASCSASFDKTCHECGNFEECQDYEAVLYRKLRAASEGK